MQNFRRTAEREFMFQLHRKKIGFKETDSSGQYSYPTDVLNFIRVLVHANIYREIKEVID